MSGTGDGKVKTQDVKKFVINNKILTVVVGAIITALTGTSVNSNIDASDAQNLVIRQERELEAHKIKIEYLESENTELKDEFFLLNKNLWKSGVFISDGEAISIALPKEYNNNDSGYCKWALEKLKTGECLLAIRGSWKVDDTMYPRVVFEDDVPIVVYDKDHKKKKVFIGTKEDWLVQDWQVYGCQSEEEDTT